MTNTALTSLPAGIFDTNVVLRQLLVDHKALCKIFTLLFTCSQISERQQAHLSTAWHILKTEDSSIAVRNSRRTYNWPYRYQSFLSTDRLQTTTLSISPGLCQTHWNFCRSTSQLIVMKGIHFIASDISSTGLESFPSSEIAAASASLTAMWVFYAFGKRLSMFGIHTRVYIATAATIISHTLHLDF